MVLRTLAQLEEYGVAHSVGVCNLVAQIALVVVALRLGAAAEFCSRKTEYAVAGAVEEELAANGISRVIVGIPALYGSNLLAIHNDVLHGGVQQQ